MEAQKCACETLYEPNENTAVDNGKYHPNEYNNNNAFYQFGYKVNAHETGDAKQHIESRTKNEVKGNSVNEPNGASRLIQYIANAKGFNAIVRHRFGVIYSRINGTNFILVQVVVNSHNFKPIHLIQFR